MHTTGSPSCLRACQSQTEVAPVSSPILTPRGALLRMRCTSRVGSDATRPSKMTEPFASSTHTLVSLSETSRATYWSMVALLGANVTKAILIGPVPGRAVTPTTPCLENRWNLAEGYDLTALQHRSE